MNASKNKRRSFLVDYKVQSALGLRVATHWLTFLVVTLCVTICLRLVTNIDQASLLQQITRALRDQAISVVVLLALMPWFVHDALGLSNRFAGPMVRLRAALRQLRTDDEPGPIKFRSGDFWIDVADDFNALRDRVVADRKEMEELRGRLANVPTELETTVELPLLTLLPAASANPQNA
jgi:hypothetical protein